MDRMRILFVLLATTIASFGAGHSVAQETQKELAIRASSEMRLLTSFRDMERSLSELNHFLAYGIVASAGGWGVIEVVNTTDYTNSYVLRNKAGEAQEVAARANAAIQRSDTSSDDQKERSRIFLENLEKMIGATTRITDALTDEEFDTAREIYRDDCQKPFEDARRTIQSTIIELERQLGSTIMKMRLTE